jgi:hypothetical protein
VRSPWLVQEMKWDAQSSHRAVIWLAATLKKAILRLTDADYRNQSLQVPPLPARLHYLPHRIGNPALVAPRPPEALPFYNNCVEDFHLPSVLQPNLVDGTNTLGKREIQLSKLGEGVR